VGLCIEKSKFISNISSEAMPAPKPGFCVSRRGEPE
jgi:hypothetical protein